MLKAIKIILFGYKTSWTANGVTRYSYHYRDESIIVVGDPI